MRELRHEDARLRRKAVLAVRELLVAPQKLVQCIAAGVTPALIALLQVSSARAWSALRPAMRLQVSQAKAVCAWTSVCMHDCSGKEAHTQAVRVQYRTRCRRSGSLCAQEPEETLRRDATSALQLLLRRELGVRDLLQHGGLQQLLGLVAAGSPPLVRDEAYAALQEACRFECGRWVTPSAASPRFQGSVCIRRQCAHVLLYQIHGEGVYSSLTWCSGRYTQVGECGYALLSNPCTWCPCPAHLPQGSDGCPEGLPGDAGGAGPAGGPSAGGPRPHSAVLLHTGAPVPLCGVVPCSSTCTPCTACET